MSTTSAERPPNPLLSHNQLARAARAAIAALVSAACLASPVAGGGMAVPAPDRIARDVLLRGTAGLAQAADEAAIPASPMTRSRPWPRARPTSCSMARNGAAPSHNAIRSWDHLTLSDGDACWPTR